MSVQFFGTIFFELILRLTMRTTKNWIFLSSVLGLALVGCGGSTATKTDAPRVAAAHECVFPDSPTDAAPLWVCDAPVEGVAVSAVGSHAKSEAGQGYMKEQAAAYARVTLAQQAKVRVTNMIKQYAEVTGSASSETVDKVNTSVSKLITTEDIVGSKIYRSATSPKGALYVLVGMDPTATKQTVEKAVRTSMGNDAALWQQFKAKKGQDELAEELAKMAAEQKK